MVRSKRRAALYLTGAAACVGLILIVGFVTIESLVEVIATLPIAERSSQFNSTAGGNSSASRVEPLPDDVVGLMAATHKKSGSEGLLARELARQAILIAARDELGLRTRDVSLRELSPTADSAALGTIRPLVVSPGDGWMAVDLQRAGREHDNQWEAKGRAGRGKSIGALVHSLEACSRTSFVESLKELGFRKAVAEKRPPAGHPPTDLCDRFDPVSQFAAVRAWHESIRTNGESPERIAGLVRGYANLGLLTEHHWSSAYKAWQARSLLYAERLIHLTGDVPESLRRRAYAKVLAGLPSAAADDLDLARRQNTPDDEPPKYAVILDAYCRGAGQELDLLADRERGADRTLALLLRLGDAELAGSQRIAESVAGTIVESRPGCVSGLDSQLGQGMPLGTRRTAQEETYTAARDWLYRPLLSAGISLPLEIGEPSKSAEEDADFRKRLNGLMIADDVVRDGTGEPSLAALGRLIEDEGFYQSYCVVTIDRWSLGVHADDRIAETIPWAWHHPLRGYIEGMVQDPSQGAPHRSQAVMALAAEELVPAYTPLRDLAIFNNPHLRDEADAYQRKNCDDVLADLVWLIGKSDSSDDRKKFVRRLERVAPNASVTVSLLARNDGDRIAGYADDWERRFSGDPVVLEALAELQLEEMNRDAATRLFQKSLEAAPESDTYHRVAKVQLFLGDERRFFETLEDSLLVRDQGLGHARSCEMIATRLMVTGKYREALPYARQAASSWSAWGILCLADCYEGLGEFDKAEQLHQQNEERYETSEGNRYLWCLRTGKGDLDAAREVYENAKLRWEQYPRTHEQWYLSLAYTAQAEGRLEQALERYVANSAYSDAETHLLHAALIADRLGQAERRDELLASAEATGSNAPPSVAFVIETIRNDLNGSPLDVEEAEAGIRRTISWNGAATDAYNRMGWHLETQGRLEDAVKFYRLAAASPAKNTVGSMLASASLRRLGESAGERRRYEVDEGADRAIQILIGAQDYLSMGRYRAALVRADAVLRDIPDSEPGHFLRAMAHGGLEHAAEAETDFRHVYESSPRRADARLYAARMREWQGNHAGAVELYMSVVSSNASAAEKSEAHFALCWLRASCVEPSMRSGADALQHADSAAALGIATPESLARARAAALAALKRYDEAISQAESAAAKFYGYDRFQIDQQLEKYRSGEPYLRQPEWWKPDEYVGKPLLRNGPARAPVEAARPK